MDAEIIEEVPWTDSLLEVVEAGIVLSLSKSQAEFDYLFF